FVEDRPVQFVAQQAGKFMAFGIKIAIRAHQPCMMQRLIYPGFQAPPKQLGNPYFLPLHSTVRKPEGRSAVVWIEPCARQTRSFCGLPGHAQPNSPSASADQPQGRSKWVQSRAQ